MPSRSCELGGLCRAMSPHSGIIGHRLCLPPCINASLTWRASARRAVNVWRKHTPTADRPGVCPQCGEFNVGALDRHMMNNHLELGQLWRYPVEVCGGVVHCLERFCGRMLDHLRSQHDGAQCFAVRLFPMISGGALAGCIRSGG